MGIGDKQRIEAERREKYARAIAEVEAKHMFYSHSRPGFMMFGCTGCSERFPDREGHPAHVAALRIEAILALVDAEIEPLQDQIEEQAQRLAMSSGLRVQVEALQATIQNAIETMVWLEAEGAEPYEKLRELLMGTVPEPEYEYGFRLHIDGRPVPPLFNSREEAQDWLNVSKRDSSEYVMMRRPKVKWEDVQ
jgi:hypothetical protein